MNYKTCIKVADNICAMCKADTPRATCGVCRLYQWKAALNKYNELGNIDKAIKHVEVQQRETSVRTTNNRKYEDRYG